MELCAGTHTRATGEIGFSGSSSESAIAAGVRRIEAVAGLPAYEAAHAEARTLETACGEARNASAGIRKKARSDASPAERRSSISSHALRQKTGGAYCGDPSFEDERALRRAAIIEQLPAASGDEVQAIADALKTQFDGVVVLAGTSGTTSHSSSLFRPSSLRNSTRGKSFRRLHRLSGEKAADARKQRAGQEKNRGRSPKRSWRTRGSSAAVRAQLLRASLPGTDIPTAACFGSRDR